MHKTSTVSVPKFHKLVACPKTPNQTVETQIRLKDLSIDEMVGPDALAVCLAHRGLSVGFLLLRYSV